MLLTQFEPFIIEFSNIIRQWKWETVSSESRWKILYS